MKDLQRLRRIQIRSYCIGVAYAVNHFQLRKKQYIVSTVTDLICSERLFRTLVGPFEPNHGTYILAISFIQ